MNGLGGKSQRSARRKSVWEEEERRRRGRSAAPSGCAGCGLSLSSGREAEAREQASEQVC